MIPFYLVYAFERIEKESIHNLVTYLLNANIFLDILRYINNITVGRQNNQKTVESFHDEMFVDTLEQLILHFTFDCIAEFNCKIEWNKKKTHANFR